MTVMCLLLWGCDIYHGQRPSDYKNTRWVSENPNIYFEVNEKFSEITGTITYGKIIIDGVTTEIAVDFGMEPVAEFRPISSYKKGEGIDGHAWLFRGRCKYSPDKLVITKIVNNSRYEESFLDESIRKITFIKEDIDN